MAVPVANAAAAYLRAAKDAQAGAGPRSVDPAQSFSEMLNESVKSAIETNRTAEAMSAKGIAGKAELNEVVAAVTNAEVTLQTVLAVRDKVIAAYQEIARMPI